MKLVFGPPLVTLLLVCLSGCSSGTTAPGSGMSSKLNTVFVIVLENHNWTGDGSRDIKDNPSAPYINGTLIPAGAHAENYWNPPNEHPSLGNFLWMEAGTDFGINGLVKTQLTVAQNTQTTHAHLTWQLMQAGLTWKAYSGKTWAADTCPVVAWSVPQVFFSDIANDASPMAPICIQHIRPLAELASDLASGSAPNYSFIVPSLCQDMHTPCGHSDPIHDGDAWLQSTIPVIQASKQYRKGGAIFIVWDEARKGDGPIPMMMLSPLAKPGYSNAIRYTHGSLLRTVEEIFNFPLLGDANQEMDLSDLFTTFP